MTRAQTRSGQKAGQLAEELSKLVNLAKKATSYLEVGARYGDTFFDVVQAMPKGSLAVCVDLPGNLWGTSGSEKSLTEACIELRSMGYQIEQIMGDSTDKNVIQVVANFARFDLALIDGDHTYNGVLTDWQNYSPLCDIVCFHDIVGNGQRHDKDHYVEVPRLWEELKANYPFDEYIANDSKMGIGVLWMKAHEMV